MFGCVSCNVYEYICAYQLLGPAELAVPEAGVARSNARSFDEQTILRFCSYVWQNLGVYLHCTPSSAGPDS